jgi:hypothetical protein
MADAKSTSNWVSLQHVYAAELERFGSSKPALQAAWRRLKAHPYRYLDSDGVLHENDLSDEFFRHAGFRPDEGSAVCPTIVVSNGGRISRWEAYAIELLIPAAALIDELFRSGAPGRPSAMEGILAEFKRRVAGEEVVPRQGCLRTEAEHLARWWAAIKPNSAPTVKAGTIENKIRQQWNSLINRI